jgi:hypothetical protein
VNLSLFSLERRARPDCLNCGTVGGGGCGDGGLGIPRNVAMSDVAEEVEERGAEVEGADESEEQ